MEEKYDKMQNAKTEEFRKVMGDNIYNLNKKILYSKDDLQRRNNETNNSKSNYENTLKEKDNQIMNLKNKIRETQTNNELLYKLCSEQLKRFINNYDKVKNLYIDREKEMINVSNYYVDIMNEYTKPLTDTEHPNNVLEKDYHKNASTVIDLYNKNDELMKQIEELIKQRVNESDGTQRKIAEGANDVDNKLKNIETKQKDLGGKMRPNWELR